MARKSLYSTEQGEVMIILALAALFMALIARVLR